MSDILIKGIEMPTSEEKCKFFQPVPFRAPFCAINGVCHGIDACPLPLMEVPTPHGDLIDRDRASERFAELAENIEAKLGFEYSASYTLASLFLQNKGEFPTIIEKEEKK